MKRHSIGILGGTFDPIHIGHLCPAIEAFERLQLDEIRLIPNSIPPHRPQPHASTADRLAMVQLAIKPLDYFCVDDRELQRKEPSYTLDTLKSLRNDFPNSSLCFLLGSDSLLSLTSWHHWQQLIDYAHLIVCYRPGWSQTFDLATQAFIKRYQSDDPNQLHHDCCGTLQWVENHPYEISATWIRQRLTQGQNVRYLLPDAVIDYIEQQGLYRPE